MLGTGIPLDNEELGREEAEAEFTSVLGSSSPYPAAVAPTYDQDKTLDVRGILDLLSALLQRRPYLQRLQRSKGCGSHGALTEEGERREKLTNAIYFNYTEVVTIHDSITETLLLHGLKLVSDDCEWTGEQSTRSWRLERGQTRLE
jgi:hypothetical protein